MIAFTVEQFVFCRSVAAEAGRTRSPVSNDRLIFAVPTQIMQLLVPTAIRLVDVADQVPFAVVRCSAGFVEDTGKVVTDPVGFARESWSTSTVERIGVGAEAGFSETGQVRHDSLITKLGSS